MIEELRKFIEDLHDKVKANESAAGERGDQCGWYYYGGSGDTLKQVLAKLDELEQLSRLPG